MSLSHATSHRPALPTSAQPARIGTLVRRDSIDPDALAYAAAARAQGAQISAPHIDRISTFIAGEKSAGRWTSIGRLYLPVWGVAAADAICLKTRLSGTWSGTVDRGMFCAASDGSSGYFNFGVSPQGLGMTSTSGQLFELVVEADPDAGFNFAMGARGASAAGEVSLFQTTTSNASSMLGRGATAPESGISQQRIGVMHVNRNTSGLTLSKRTVGGGVVRGGTNATAEPVTSVNLIAMGLNDNGAASFLSRAKVGAFGAGTGFLNNAAVDAFTLALQTLWTALRATGPADTDVAAYVVRTGGMSLWDHSRARRLDDCVTKLKASGLGPLQLFVFGADYRSLTGSTYRPVLGADGTLSGGTSADNTEELVLNGNAVITFAVPAAIKSATATELSLMATASAESNYVGVIASPVGGSAGPELMLDGSSIQGNTISEVFGDVVSTGWRSTEWSVPHGIKAPIALGYKAGDDIYVYGGASRGKRGSGVPANVFNNNANYIIGNNVGGFFNADGARVGLAMVTQSAVNTDARYAAFLDAVYGSGVQTPEVDALAIFDGDSLMEGAGSSTTPGDFAAALHATAGSGWHQNMHWRNIGIGGSGIASNEAQFASIVTPFLSIRAFRRYYVLWGGTNESVYYEPSAANRVTLAARYVALLVAARALGATPVMVTPLLDIGRTTAEQAYQDAYVVELKAQCAAAGVTVVDAHNDADLRAHTPGFYSDTIHLTNTGYARVRSLFVAAIPNP